MNEFVKEIKKLFKTSLIDQFTFFNIESHKGDIIQYRDAMIKLRNLLLDQSTKDATMEVSHD